jgi:hypothetical protein
MRKLPIFIAGCLFTLAACGTPEAISMYPEPLKAASTVESNAAIALVGNGGNDTIDYVQFVHNSFPAINARGINLPPGGIVAIPVPVGTTGLSLNVYTTSGRPGGYLPSGMAMGYVSVHTPAIDINTAGLYYIATIFPERKPNYEVKPSPPMLTKFKAEQREISRLRPINFSWSR